MKKTYIERLHLLLTIFVLLFSSIIIIPTETVTAGSYNGEDLALAILADPSTLISSSYSDNDQHGNRESIVLSSLGTMQPINGSTFALMSTGIAGSTPVTANGCNPGDERGTNYRNKFGQPRDEATLTLKLKVPDNMYYLYYDIQFYSTEYPEYIGSQYNDKLTITVTSPSKGPTTYIFDVNNGDFVLNANDITGTGYDIFATSGNPSNVDWVNTTPSISGADAGATALIGKEHPVSPAEEVTITFTIEDVGDSQFDSTAFIDNLRFSGYGRTEIIARTTAIDLNSGTVESGDIIEYRTIISNVGSADQNNNPGDEFVTLIPNNTTYIEDSSTETSGTTTYDSSENKITWNGAITKEDAITLTFQVQVNTSIPNGTAISNQGVVYWDSNGDGTNDATELTDDPNSNDGIDLDGDGDTDDDDPTVIFVYAYKPPSIVIEDFSDGTPGSEASQSYCGYTWFWTTNTNETVGSKFEVDANYRYSTARSFKTQLRSSGSPQYWYYNLSAVDSDIEWWEIWFACGNTSDKSDLLVDLKNNNEQDIAKIKFEYVKEGTYTPSDYVLKMYFYHPMKGWIPLKSDYEGGYLFNGWYKLRIGKNGTTKIDYHLYHEGNLVDLETAGQLSASFSNLASIEWTSTTDPVVCPMFFWDEHKLGLTTI